MSLRQGTVAEREAAAVALAQSLLARVGADLQDVADRALLARDVIALKPGPEKTADALEDCRRRYAGQARG